MIEHLVVSTVILGLGMLAAWLLPITARTRHAVLVCCVAKFAIPTALLDTLGLKVIRMAPMPLRVFDGTANVAAPPAAAPTNWLLIGWAAIASIVFARWLLLRSRTVTAALRSPAPPSQRELDALAEAKRRLGVTSAIDIIRSPICEAPAVLRIVRPVVLLPARGCDDLSEDELRALLLHEVAHVGRRDNLTASFTALAAALLWFHPLVWLALRQIDAAREQACDERVSESMGHVESYLEALTKVCRALIAPRTAGVSCMAGANVKERMEHLMRYESLRKRAWSHRAVVAMAAIVVVAATAIAATPPKNQELYSLNFVIEPRPRNSVLFDIGVIENATKEIAGSARVTAARGMLASWSKDHNGRKIEVQMRMHHNRPAELILTAKENGEVVQRTLYTWQPTSSEFSGQPIDLSLKDANLADVMETFGQITGLEIEVAPEIADTKVTIDVKQWPWDEAMMEIAKMTGTKITIEGKTIRVTK